jgi:hypothetical protein
MSEDETAMIVALSHGNAPRTDDPIAKALEARGLFERAADGDPWHLTPSGAGYLAELTPG